MKSIISIVLLIFFLTGNSYSALNIHYCGGKVKSVSFTKAKQCGMCSKKAMEGCCSDVQKLLKADDFSKTQMSFHLKTFFSSFIAVFYPKFSFSLIEGEGFVNRFFAGDIPRLSTSIFIRICALII